MTALREWIRERLAAEAVGKSIADMAADASIITAILLLAIVANFVAKRIILRGIKSIIAKTETQWDDIFMENKVFDRLSHLAPATIVYLLADLAFPSSEALVHGAKQICIAYMLMIVTIVLDGFLDAVLIIYRTFEISKTRPIKAYLQVLKIVMYMLSAILVVSTLTDSSPWALITGLAGLTAVILFVFKDSIMGLVASIQLTTNNMVQVGDWIEMPKFNADGDVLEVSLNTVRVQNWDKTISTIPTYALMSETFRNWRGMSESGGRRIKRAIHIDMNSVKFCDAAMLKRFERIEFIKEHLADKQRVVTEYNSQHEVDTSMSINGRRLTNLGTFRAYVFAYLRNHPKIHNDMTFLVRHLPPGPEGLGIEIYVFSNDQVWANYEAIQADIFDHLLAVLQEFDLRVFQNPAGADFRRLGGPAAVTGSSL